MHGSVSSEFETRQDASRVPIHDGDQVHKSLGHRDVADVRGSELVHSVDLEAAQQVRIELVARAWLPGATLRVQGLQPHLPH
jgi:hypothetical protein